MAFAKIPADLSTSILGGGVAMGVAVPQSHNLVSTKLMATIGPSSRSSGILKEMLRAGMQLARFDFAWSPSTEYHQESLDNLKIAIKETGIECGIVLETAGREIIVLNRPSGSLELTAGQNIVLSCDKSAKATTSLLPLSTLETFHGHGLIPGSSIYLGTYLVTGSERSTAVLTLVSLSPDGKSAECKVANACSLEGEQVVVNAFFSAPGPSLTPEDVTTIKSWGKRNEIDYLSLAFTHSAEDVHEARQLLDSIGLSKTKIFGKIETVEGLRSLEPILDVVDAIIFSRGNLGVSLEPEKMFRVQKTVLNRCNIRGRPVFVSRVVDTMEIAPRPTRAEATDVANLCLDGADGILFGGETFRGVGPVATIKTVAAICLEAEKIFDSPAFYRSYMDQVHLGGYSIMTNFDKAEALASSSVRAADKSGAQLIIVFTVTGRTASLLSRFKPRAPILAVICPNAASAEFSTGSSGQGGLGKGFHRMSQQNLLSYESDDGSGRQSHSKQSSPASNHTLRQCLALRGVVPVMADASIVDSSGLLSWAVVVAKEKGLVLSGDKIIVSLCPRKDFSPLIDELGVMSLIEA